MQGISILLDSFNQMLISILSFLSAVSDLSSEELAAKRSLLHLQDAEDLLLDHLTSVKHEEATINKYAAVTSSHTVDYMRLSVQMDRNSAQYCL